MIKNKKLSLNRVSVFTDFCLVNEMSRVWLKRPVPHHRNLIIEDHTSSVSLKVASVWSCAKTWELNAKITALATCFSVEERLERLPLVDSVLWFNWQKYYVRLLMVWCVHLSLRCLWWMAKCVLLWDHPWAAVSPRWHATPHESSSLTTWCLRCPSSPPVLRGSHKRLCSRRWDQFHRNINMCPAFEMMSHL